MTRGLNSSHDGLTFRELLYLLTRPLQNPPALLPQGLNMQRGSPSPPPPPGKQETPVGSLTSLAGLRMIRPLNDSNFLAKY